jgi:hypothetical protein
MVLFSIINPELWALTTIGSAQSLIYDSGQTLGPSTERPYETGTPGIVNALTPDSGSSATSMLPSAAPARSKYLPATTSINPELYVQWPSMGPPINGPCLWRRSADVMQPTSPVWCPASPYRKSSTEPSAYIRLTQQRLLFMKCPRQLPRIMAQHPVDASVVPTWRHYYSDRSTHVESCRRTQGGYLCPTCSKLFSRPSGLKIHLHSHTGEKPYRCGHEGCGKCFSVKSNMTRHRKCSHDRGIGVRQCKSIIPLQSTTPR